MVINCPQMKRPLNSLMGDDLTAQAKRVADVFAAHR